MSASHKSAALLYIEKVQELTTDFTNNIPQLDKDQIFNLVLQHLKGEQMREQATLQAQTTAPPTAPVAPQ